MEASALHDIGTFAHVHTIHYASGAAHGGGAMVLLVGHRRVEQLKTVGPPLEYFPGFPRAMSIILQQRKTSQLLDLISNLVAD